MTSHTNGPYASDATASNAGVYDTTEGLDYPQSWPITTTSQVAASAPFELAGPSYYAQTSSPYALDVAVDTSVPPGWTDNIGQRSEYVPLPASDRLSLGRSDTIGSQRPTWMAALPTAGNVPQVYGYPTPPQNNTHIMFGAGRQHLLFNARDPVNNEEPVGNAFGGQAGLYYPLPVHDYPSQHQSDASLSSGSGYLDEFKTIYSLRTHLAKSCKRPVGKPEEPQDVYVLAESIWAAAEARAAAEGARAESPS
ncbi:hypothetical protein JB92DRAFT_2835330 [Gautieria morchelliformis]|nr:hypothetical protein JB92DRAFT_2835330 [Gautieria morchelliformis]